MAPISPSSAPDARPRDIEEPLDDYRPVSGFAVAGLLLGLGSVAALIHPVLWVVPLCGVVATWYALRQIALGSPPLLGRKAALIGLTLSLIFGLSGPLVNWAHRRALRAQALEMAAEWFTAWRENRPDYAIRLSQRSTTKTGRDKSPLAESDSRDRLLGSLRKDVHEQPADLLLKLGKQAHVRHFQNESIWWDDANEGVRDLYVVTVGQGSDAVSFFVRLGLLRSQDRATGEWQWQITKHEFVTFPDGQLLDALE